MFPFFKFWYNPEDISTSVAYFLTEGSTRSSPALNSSLYLHDLVDLTRQFLINLGGFGYHDIMEAYQNGDVETFWQELQPVSMVGVEELFLIWYILDRKESSELLEILDDLDLLLSTNAKFLLGKWTQEAELWAQAKPVRKLHPVVSNYSNSSRLPNRLQHCCLL